MEDASSVPQASLEAEDHKGLLVNEDPKDLKGILVEMEEMDTKEVLVRSAMLDHPAPLETLDLKEDLDRTAARESESLENPDHVELQVLPVFQETEEATEVLEPLENLDHSGLLEMTDLLDNPEDPGLLETEDFPGLTLITALVLLDKFVICGQ